ncbi:hypothetical protein OG900_17100 [Streptomyces sp. NBC_00433]
MGLPADLQVVADGMVGASMELVTTVMTGTRDTTIAVFHELDRQRGMAGADDAGHDFAKVYRSAAAETLDQLGFSAYMIGESGAGLMRSAREFIGQEDATAASFMARQPDPTFQMGDPSRGCSERFVGLGEDLPEVVGETSFADQYLSVGNAGGRFRGSPDKLRDVAGTWSRAGTVMARLLVDAQGCGHTADKAHSGLAADAFRAHFTAFVGFSPPPALAQQDEPLVANVVAACDQLAQACLQYASHIDQALSAIAHDKANPFHMDAPWSDPLFGGNGDDGGLKDLVRDDPWIHALGDVAHALDASRGRVKIPNGSRPGPRPWYEPPLLPFPVPLPEPVPVPLVLASYPGAVPGLLPAAYNPINQAIPFRPPLPPAPGVTKPLSPADQRAFTTWVNGLEPVTFSGGGGNPANPVNVYQYRIAGYPERVIPITGGPKPALAADGMRSSDGYAVEAKHVTNPNKCWRYSSTLQLMEMTDPKTGKPLDRREFLVDKDRGELFEYKLAIKQYPQLRGVEIDADDPDSVAYWSTLLTEQTVPGYARYVP